MTVKLQKKTTQKQVFDMDFGMKIETFGKPSGTNN